MDDNLTPQQKQTRFYFVRHAQTSFNEKRPSDTDKLIDSPLTSRGKIEAEQTAYFLRYQNPSDARITIIRSPLKRTIDTSTPLIKLLQNDKIKHQVIDLHQLHEYQQESQQIPMHLKEVITGDKDWESFWARVRKLPGLLRESAKDSKIVVVFSHARVISCLIQYLMSQETSTSCPNLALKIYNCSISIVDYNNGEWNFVRINDIDHLNYDD